LHGWAVDRLERLGTTSGELLEGPAIEVNEQLGDRCIELGECEELAVA